MAAVNLFWAIFRSCITQWL